MEKREDELTKHLSCANRMASPADGANILECYAEVRMKDRAREENLWGYASMPDSFSEKDWAYRRNYSKHFLERGGMTWDRGDALPDLKG